jgi:hypothetical protein
MSDARYSNGVRLFVAYATNLLNNFLVDIQMGFKIITENRNPNISEQKKKKA